MNTCPSAYHHHAPIRCLPVALLSFLLLVSNLYAGEPHFFRVQGSTATTITGFSSDGYITWANAKPGDSYTVQVATRLGPPGNWVDYIQVAASNQVVTHRLYDPNSPGGMALIPAGSFTMGNCMDPAEGLYYELPLHTVYVSAFYMDKYEVTKALWDDVYAWAITNGYSFQNPVMARGPNHPAWDMNWYDAVKWCNARSEKEGRVPAYFTNASFSACYRSGRVDVQAGWVKWNAGYRLPTEAEWEKAARGGASRHRFAWSDTDTISHSRANYDSHTGYAYDVSPTQYYHPEFWYDPPPYTSPVGHFEPNGYGLYDMIGNLCEWCWDWWDLQPYPEQAQIDPHGPGSGTYRAYRGAGWAEWPPNIRVSHRDGVGAVLGYGGIGFRCVLPAGE